MEDTESELPKPPVTSTMPSLFSRTAACPQRDSYIDLATVQVPVLGS